jgi:hypothetical protein
VKMIEKLRHMAFSSPDEEQSNFLHEVADELERMRKDAAQRAPHALAWQNNAANSHD